MERKEFFKTTLTLCGIALIPAGLIESCSKSNSYTGPTNVNFTLDLTTSAYSALNTVGGSVVVNGLIVVRQSASVFDALSATCTHAGCTLGYNSSAGQIQCPCHGGTYNVSTGAVTGGPPPSALTKYNAALSGHILTITS